ncbi:pH-response regulator protein palH/rim-21 [Podospora appendiculata]|uniref:PH-response regulator protein palH/rim-21 n=1 Tax=Podospora appendiculata TaxID=314037 RepID=A0AAE0XFM1_9PEZI|nr:pH-response regulator protein palH/rim-21 [Podospora appendiculata]
MEPRELLGIVTAITAAVQPTITPAIAARANAACNVVNLPKGGILSLPNGDIVTLTSAAAFRPTCTPANAPAIINGGIVAHDETSEGAADADGTSVTGRDPFYASTFPQCYALAATTIVAYTLVIMLLITPRSFLDGGVVVLGRKGFTNGGSGTNIGGRPWLQKVAALTVAISLTIATAATFRVAEYQYSNGYQNARSLQEDVLGGNELKIIRIISDTFLWLAQAQTLIRLFPRQREKIIIKWTAFALISLDVVFQSLTSFQYTALNSTKPRTFTEAVPALSYLFALALGFLYAAWVIYYSLMKKRYAFYHPQMKNICLVAALSLLSILIPVVFFILDIVQPDFTGWGDYVRWVGAAAASVVVWEWVERIEALEREEKKDGILGREVFDGDEMLEVTPASFNWPRRRRKDLDDTEGDGGMSGPDSGSTTARGTLWPSVTSIASKYRGRPRPRSTYPNQPAQPPATRPTNHDRIRFSQPPLWPARPAPAATPVSRTDTASAASTVYAVRYHPLTESISRTTPPLAQDSTHLSQSNSTTPSHQREERSTNTGPPRTAASSAQKEAPGQHPDEVAHGPIETTSSRNRWGPLARGLSLPHRSRDDEARVPNLEDKAQRAETGRWDLRSRLEEFAVTHAERLREKIRPTPDTGSLPVTVIPAPPRRGAALAQLREEEEELESQRHAPSNGVELGGRNSHTSRTSPTEDTAPPLAVWRLNASDAPTATAPMPRPHLSPALTQGSRHGNLPVTIIAAPPRREAGAAPGSRQQPEAGRGNQSSNETLTHNGSR